MVRNMPDSESTALTSLARVDTLMLALGMSPRWQILRELLKGEALPVKELSVRIGLPMTNTSKHVQNLARAGIVEQTYNRAYRVVRQYVGTEPDTVDLGVMVLRLGQLAAR